MRKTKKKNWTARYLSKFKKNYTCIKVNYGKPPDKIDNQ